MNYNNNKNNLSNILATIASLNLFVNIENLKKDIFLHFKTPTGRGDICQIRLKNKNFFLNAKPFSHIEFNNFFDDQYLEKILDAFPRENFKNYDHNFKNETEVKLAINSPEKIPDKINSFIDLLRPLGLNDISRTGLAAIARGSKN